MWNESLQRDDIPNHKIKKENVDWIRQEYKILENKENYIKVDLI